MIPCWFAHLIAECVFICSCPVCFLSTSEFQEYSQLILDIAAFWRYNLISCEWLTFIHAHTHTRTNTTNSLNWWKFQLPKSFYNKNQSYHEFGLFVHFSSAWFQISTSFSSEWEHFFFKIFSYIDFWQFHSMMKYWNFITKILDLFIEKLLRHFVATSEKSDD